MWSLPKWLVRHGVPRTAQSQAWGPPLCTALAAPRQLQQAWPPAASEPYATLAAALGLCLHDSTATGQCASMLYWGNYLQ